MSTTTERQRTRRRQRRISRRRFDRKGGDYKDTCHWCGKAVVWYARVPRPLRISTNNASTAWILVDGAPTMCAVATLDHVTELHDGGGVGTENVVTSCFACNHDRSATPSPYGDNRPCVEGCGRNARKAKKRCRPCEDRLLSRYQWNPS